MIELHCHIDGSMRHETLVELGEKYNVYIPHDLKFQKGMSLYDALSKFRTTLACMQNPDDVKRVCEEICEDFTGDYLELRFAPQLHKGACVDEIIEAAIDGLDGRTHLILCGLYGEDPRILNGLVDVARCYDKVVGIDLAGGPSKYHQWKLKDYAEPFCLAEKDGLGRTVHAAEGRSANEIMQAILFLKAQRIGHGTTLLNNRMVLEMVKERGVCIEACVTSNMHTGVIETISDHPIKTWIKEQIPVAICADNIYLSDIDTRREIIRVATQCDLTASELSWCLASASNHKFCKNV